MSKSVRIRRGTELDHQQFVGAEGEITMDTTLDTLRIHDGIQTGGFALLNADKNSVIRSAELITNKILYKNNYASVGALPSASTYPGLVATVGTTVYISNGTVWNTLLQTSDLAPFATGSISSANTPGVDFEVANGKTGTNLVFRSLRPGNNITLAQDAASITINSTNYQGVNLSDGAGALQVYSGTDQTTDTLSFRSIRPGSGIIMSNSLSNNELNIDTVLKQAFNTVTAGAVNIATNTANSTLNFTAGSGLQLTGNNTTKTINISLDLTAANNSLQTGSSVLQNYINGSFMFNKIKAGAGVLLSTGSNGEIVINAPQVGTITDAVNLAPPGFTSLGLYKESADGILKFYNIEVGDGLSIEYTPDGLNLKLVNLLAGAGGAGVGTIGSGVITRLAYYSSNGTVVDDTGPGVYYDIGNDKLVADVTGQVSSIANHTTDELTEGATNVYWTQTRFDDALALKDTDALSEGDNRLYFTDLRAKLAVGNMLELGNTLPTSVVATMSSDVTTTATVTVPSVTNIVTGMVVTGAGIPAGVTVGTVGFTTFTVTPAIYAPSGTSLTLTGTTTLIVNTSANTTSTALVNVTDATGITNGMYVNGTGISGRVTVTNVSSNAITVTPGYNISSAAGTVLTFSELTTGVTSVYDDALQTFSYNLDTNYLGNIVRNSLSVTTGQGLSYDPVQGRFGLSGAVTSVNGYSGAVQLTVGDIAGAAPSASPILTGSPRVPDLISTSNSFQIANKSYVDATRTSITGATLPGLATLQALGNAINGDTLFYQTVNSLLAGKLSTSGGTLNGPLNLNYEVLSNSNELIAVNKRYVDTRATVQTVNTKSGQVILYTDDITERVSPAASNLWFSSSRARSSISLTTSDSSVLSYNTGTGVLTFNKPTTDNITEGSNNQYYTTSRVRNAIGISVTGNTNFASYNSETGVFTINATSDNISQGSTNRFYTDTLSRAALQLQTSTTQGALLTYNNTTGVFTINARTSNVPEDPAGPFYFTNNKVYSAISAVTTQLDNVISANALVFNSSTGQFTFNANTNNITEGSVNRYFSEARARASITVSSTALNVMSYDNATGVITYNNPNTDSISEGSTNRYFTQTRARDSITLSITNLSGTSNAISTWTPATGVLTVNANTDSINEGSTNRFASIANVGAIVNLATTTSDSALTSLIAYDSATARITFNNSTDSLREGLTNKWASDATVRGKVTATTTSIATGNSINALRYGGSAGIGSGATAVSAGVMNLSLFTNSSITWSPTADGLTTFHLATQQDITSTTGTPSFVYVSKTKNPGTVGYGGRIAISSAEVTIDCSRGGYHEVQRDGAITTLSFSNPPPTGVYTEMTVCFYNAIGTASFGNGNSKVHFANGAPPTLGTTTGRRDIFKFYTYGSTDGGPTFDWYELSRSLNVA